MAKVQIKNNSKEKNPALAEIEGDTTPIIEEEENTTPAPTVSPAYDMQELLKKDPDEITAEEMDFISDNKEDLSDEDLVRVGLMDAEELGDEGKEEDKEDEEEEIEEDKTPAKKKVAPPPTEIEEESEEDKEKKYRSQQTEAQIQAEKNKALTDRVEEAANLPEPTEEEVAQYVRSKGVDPEELTAFELAMAKDSLINSKRFGLVNDAVKSQKQVDKWAGDVDSFIESTDSKPEYVDLSGHEDEFRKYAMKESHRGAPLDVLAAAFLHTLPPAKPNRGELFQRGGGGEREKRSDGIMDADRAAELRKNNPKEYKRLVKAQKIKLDI